MGAAFAMLFRAARIAVAIGGGTAAAKVLNEPNALWLGPIVGGLMKGARIKYPETTKLGKILKWIPL